MTVTAAEEQETHERLDRIEATLDRIEALVDDLAEEEEQREPL